MVSVDEYIKNKWKETERFCPLDDGTLIGVPYPYAVPTANGAFNEMYYWDTYFANKGLIIDEKFDLALNNCKNMLFLVEKFGYMPNGNRTWYIGRSQPPYLAMAVDDLYRESHDKKFLRSTYATLQKEYLFWSTKRITETGLNRYYNEHTERQCIDGYYELSVRVKSPFEDPIEGGRNLWAEAESGWDFNPRFGGKCTHYNPVDLNSNLYKYEKLFAKFERELGLSDGAYYESVAAKRKERVDFLCYNEKLGVYNDYDFTQRQASLLFNAACVWPYFMGLADKSRVGGLKKVIEVLEAPFGIFTTEPTKENFQWGYPNVWAPCIYATVSACLNYGLKDDAVRMADKYISLIDKNYKETGGLWEKYNALDGTINCANEYEMPQMMGWTAGVYKALKALLIDEK